MLELLQDFTLQTVASGAALLGLLSGALGSFALLRKQSLLGDSISHAALPGIVLAFIITGSKSSLVLLLGAAFAGWIGTWLILSIIRNTRLTSDGAQGVILSVFFGIGLLLLTYVQSQPNAAQAGLDKYLFGQAAALLPEDVLSSGILSILSLLILFFLWKEIKLMTFDPVYGESLGFSSKVTDFVITGLIVIAIVTGLQTVGVILMSSMLIAPAAAARQWTDRLGVMVILSSLFGSVAGVAGAILSSIIPNLPTGPTIVLCLTFLVCVSLFLAPNRGILSQMIKRFNNRYAFSLQKLLMELYYLEKDHDEVPAGHDKKTISLIRERKGSITVALNTLLSRGLVERTRDGLWRLTDRGRKEAVSLNGGASHDI
ncbi:iron chelate uptake ABC transporter family permease subunit [Spirochaeta cellobiosiphila]|uniref:metal ABC transporter permease n=1 Tax=Spirochaeta cellobiosiphila TaxID=504483 RepID=UPI00041969DD|nr:iron chelate uptake ABC transporter family permease subunit [Spirochaeta cellobiosiphila]